jgi:hypothetical protein
MILVIKNPKTGLKKILEKSKYTSEEINDIIHFYNSIGWKVEGNIHGK